MMPTENVTYTTPDGVERILRFTLGARRRIAEWFNEPDVIVILQKISDGALPDIAYAMMYDAAGDPPEGLDRKTFAESLDDGVPLLAAVMSAVGKGATPKNELEAMLREAKQKETTRLIGSVFGASPDIASISAQVNSGGLQSGSIPHSVTVTANASGLPTSEAA